MPRSAILSPMAFWMSRLLVTVKPISKKTKSRVAAYARVSTDEEEQLNSYEAQVRYYSEYIKSHPDWEFVEVYSDERISGTHTEKRAGVYSRIYFSIVTNRNSA